MKIIVKTCKKNKQNNYLPFKTKENLTVTKKLEKIISLKKIFQVKKARSLQNKIIFNQQNILQNKIYYNLQK